MLETINITADEARELLRAETFGHLGFAHEGQPYVLPINYAYDGDEIFFVTTPGAKSRVITTNPKVCLQVERVQDRTRWQSVLLTGRAELLTAPAEIERAVERVTVRNPTQKPATERRFYDNEGVVAFRIRPANVSGRKTIEPPIDADQSAASEP